jgi:hypothetical protein
LKALFFKNLLSFIIISVFPFHLSSCVSFGPTEPNIPYAGNPSPSVLNDLDQRNPLLVQELGKLPELQDGISSEEVANIEQLNKFYFQNQVAFDKIFQKMYQVGLSEHRKYCTPLQALYWLVEDGKIDTLHDLIDVYVYSLENLLSVSWDFDGNSERWSDFNTVVDRLNTPELLDYYINHNITYKKNRTNSHTPKHTFLYHWGDCDDLAVFGKYILNKGGYKVDIRYVHWTSDNRGHVGVVIKSEDGHYLLPIDFSPKGNTMSGPYKKISQVDIKLSYGHSFHDSGWWRQPR